MELKSRVRILSAAESEAVVVKVSSVEKLSGRAMVTYSVWARLQDKEKMKITTRNNDNDLCKTMYPPCFLI